jgi:hypothetical protein
MFDCGRPPGAKTTKNYLVEVEVPRLSSNTLRNMWLRGKEIPHLKQIARVPAGVIVASQSV